MENLTSSQFRGLERRYRNASVGHNLRLYEIIEGTKVTGANKSYLRALQKRDVSVRTIKARAETLSHELNRFAYSLGERNLENESDRAHAEEELQKLYDFASMSLLRNRYAKTHYQETVQSTVAEFERVRNLIRGGNAQLEKLVEQGEEPIEQTSHAVSEPLMKAKPFRKTREYLSGKRRRDSLIVRDGAVSGAGRHYADIRGYNLYSNDVEREEEPMEMPEGVLESAVIGRITPRDVSYFGLSKIASVHSPMVDEKDVPVVLAHPFMGSVPGRVQSFLKNHDDLARKKIDHIYTGPVGDANLSIIAALTKHKPFGERKIDAQKAFSFKFPSLTMPTVRMPRIGVAGLMRAAAILGALWTNSYSNFSSAVQPVASASAPVVLSPASVKDKPKVKEVQLEKKVTSNSNSNILGLDSSHPFFILQQNRYDNPFVVDFRSTFSPSGLQDISIRIPGGFRLINENN